jgi:hypothetical protein
METQVECQCCFCGQTIEHKGPDPCGLSLVVNFLLQSEDQVAQGLYCHLKCLEDRFHSSVILYVKDLYDDI